MFVLKVGVFSAQKACNSGKYTASGECCKQCPPGEGVVQPCGETQTVCQPCLDSEYTTDLQRRFRANYSQLKLFLHPCAAIGVSPDCVHLFCVSPLVALSNPKFS